MLSLTNDSEVMPSKSNSQNYDVQIDQHKIFGIFTTNINAKIVQLYVQLNQQQWQATPIVAKIDQHQCQEKNNCYVQINRLSWPHAQKNQLLARKRLYDCLGRTAYNPCWQLLR